MASYFELKSAAQDKYMFNLKAGNHEVILTSQSYTSKASALAGIESVRKNAASDARFERKKATNDAPYFVLAAINGQTIGKSEMYSSASTMENGIKSVMANAPTATLKDLTGS